MKSRAKRKTYSLSGWWDKNKKDREKLVRQWANHYESAMVAQYRLMNFSEEEARKQAKEATKRWLQGLKMTL